MASSFGFKRILDFGEDQQKSKVCWYQLKKIQKSEDHLIKSFQCYYKRQYKKKKKKSAQIERAVNLPGT